MKDASSVARTTPGTTKEGYALGTGSERSAWEQDARGQQYCCSWQDPANVGSSAGANDCSSSNVPSLAALCTHASKAMGSAPPNAPTEYTIPRMVEATRR
eukprot:3934813-Rhodomonas_salina.2